MRVTEPQPLSAERSYLFKEKSKKFSCVCWHFYPSLFSSIIISLFTLGLSKALNPTKQVIGQLIQMATLEVRNEKFELIVLLSKYWKQKQKPIP